MMKKRIAVIFTSNNARILVNPENIELLRKRPNVVIDPDLTLVHGILPQYWRLLKGKIVPMGHVEAEMRRAHVEHFGADNDIEHALQSTKLERILHQNWFWVGVAFCLVALGLAMGVHFR